MKLDRKEIIRALETISVAGEGKNLVESGALQNVMTFGDEVVVDLILSNPALHIRKRAEVDVMKVIHEKVYEKAKVKVNIKVQAPEKKCQRSREKRFPESRILWRWHLEKVAWENLP